MRNVIISDATMKETGDSLRLTFKEKIELSKLLDRLGVDFIELEGIKNERTDSLQIKSIAAAVTECGVAVPVELSHESVDRTVAALREAKHPRLQVCAPASSVQIEYLFHMKPSAMLLAVEETVKYAALHCDDVEFIAADATRSEDGFLPELISTAIKAGATTVTLCDTAGTMLPEELAAFVSDILSNTEGLCGVTLGICTTNTISMADAAAIATLCAGATQIRASAYPTATASLASIARIIGARGESLGVRCGVRSTVLSRITEQIQRLCQGGKGKISAAVAHDGGEELSLSASDSFDGVAAAVSELGYDLSEEDLHRVYGAFLQIAEKREKVSQRELDAIIASSAMQVPSTYKLDTYLVSTGNTVSATAHIKLSKNGESFEGVYIGDGPIDAAFQAIEKITGCHYELDDFQIQAVTEGREAMGQTVVKLRAGGRVFSGRGISTDIVGAGIQAYLSALNKIAYEEEIE